MKFGDRLKQLRAEKGITQDKLAEELKIPNSTIRRLEAADDDSIPRKDRLEAIASYFKCSTDYLLGRTDVRELVEDLANKTKKGPAAKEDTLSYEPEYLEFIRKIEEEFNVDLSNRLEQEKILETLRIVSRIRDIDSRK